MSNPVRLESTLQKTDCYYYLIDLRLLLKQWHAQGISEYADLVIHQLKESKKFKFHQVVTFRKKTMISHQNWQILDL